MTELHRIAIDTMSGDNGLSAAIPAALSFLKEFDDTALILVGDESKILDELEKHRQQPNDRLKVQHASEVVLMDESPALALRGKKDSSMRVAINLVKAADADAAVSAGNTGALMATGRFVLRTLKGIDRPAICAPIPAASGHTYMLDLGANIDSTAEHLYQFAIMGAELAHAIDGNKTPRVGLLNIGSEDMKGNEQVNRLMKSYKMAEFNYIGFVEGNDIFHGDVDVIVLLKGFRHRFDHRRYNGASFLGLKGIVIKSHGGADDVAFANAIGIARKAVIEKVPDKIEEHLQKHLID
ncbi:Phosphate acyltransferase [Nymphon striatum]|nr:Phosphate acyltransferase [Nymphon striatum]